MQQPEILDEHRWLDRLVGAWSVEGECVMGPDQPPMKSFGNETVRSLGGLWTLGEGTMTFDGGTGTSIMTLGYDPAKQRFVGTFTASMMTHLWVYSGTLDATRKVLTLDTEGPSFAGDGTYAKYQDIITFLSDNHRLLTSRYLLPDGSWITFMSANYRRV
jgi:hypothetical protein